MTQATLGVHPTDDGWVRIALGGEIDLANAGEVESRLHASLDNHVAGVTVDLTGVTYIDSVGVRILVMLASRLELLNTPLRLQVPGDSLARRVVEITGLEALTSDPP